MNILSRYTIYVYINSIYIYIFKKIIKIDSNVFVFCASIRAYKWKSPRLYLFNVIIGTIKDKKKFFLASLTVLYIHVIKIVTEFILNIFYNFLFFVNFCRVSYIILVIDFFHFTTYKLLVEINQCSLRSIKQLTNGK